MAAILGGFDPLDGVDFDSIEYVNAIFPNGNRYSIQLWIKSPTVL